MPGFTNQHDAKFYDFTGLQSPDDLVSFNGENDALLNGVENTVFPNGGLYAFPAAEVAMTISSDDAADDGAGTPLTGLRSVLVQGLDGAFNRIQEVVVLNGVAGVTLAKTYLRINAMIGLSAGSGGKNAGNVFVGTGTITLGEPAVVVSMISVGSNLSHVGVQTIPAGYSGYVAGAIFSAENNKTTEFRVYTRVPGGIFLSVADFLTESSPIVLNRIIPFRRLPEKLDVEIRALGVGATSIARTFITFALIRNE